MRNHTLPLFFLLLVTSLWAQPQLSELTLSDAILKSRSSLGPERIANLQWIAASNDISFLSTDHSQIMRQTNTGDKASVAATLDEINNACQLSMKHIPSINWMESNRFYFHSNNAYYAFETDSKKGYLLLEHPAEAENLDFVVTYNRLAYTIDNDLYIAKANVPKIKVVENEDRNIVSGQAIARHEFGISKGTFWSPKSTYLAFYQKDETNVADYPLLDITTTPGTLRTTKYPMTGQASEHGSVGVFNRKTNKLVYLKVDGPKDQYVTNLAWDPSEEFVYVAVVNRDQNHVWLNKYKAEDGSFVKTLFEEKHDKYVEPENAAWFLPNNPKEFLWMSERDGFMHVYRYDTNGTLLGQVTKGNWVVLSILGLDESGKKIVVHGTDQNGLNRFAYKASLDGSSIDQLPGAMGMHRFQLSYNGKLIDQYSSLKEPSVINLLDGNGAITKNILTASNPLKNYKFPTTELIEVKADNGLILNARMIKPSNFDSTQSYPVLVYVYGGPHAQMVSNRWLAGAPMWMHYMAEKGYIIFTLDNRGSANRGLDFENIIHRQLGEVEMRDQMAGVSYLKSLPFVDQDRMAVHGWSYGGFMTTSLMLRMPEVFKVGVAGGPVTDWKYYEAMYGERYMDRPEENPEGYKNNRLMNHVKNLKGDLLLIHGTVDDVVVIQHNYALVQAFVKEGILMDFFPYPMHPHNVRGKDRVHLMNKVLTYIEDKLK